MESKLPLITAICPVYNEEKHIKKIIHFFLNSEPENKELLIIDGNSTDRTREIVKEFADKRSNVKLLINEKRYSPFALNLGIRNSAGKIIIHTNGHSVYADDFYLKVIETFEKTGADIVGGPIRTKGETVIQRAVGFCTATSFGVGGSKCHDENYEGEIDHAYVAAIKREVFDDAGLFDERLIKNQDDEFNYRARSLGKKVYQSPEIKVWYYPKDSISVLAKHYYLFGLFKPLVLKKVKSGIKPRHLIPSFFALYLLTIPIVFALHIWIIPLILYLFIDLFFSFFRSAGLKEKLVSMLIYPAIHLGYGFGFLAGLINFRKIEKGEYEP